MALGSAVGDRGDGGCQSGVIVVKAELLPVEKTVPQEELFDEKIENVTEM